MEHCFVVDGVSGTEIELPETEGKSLDRIEREYKPVMRWMEGKDIKNMRYRYQ